MTPANRWKDTRKRNTPEHVGKFFEGLAGCITGARKTNRGTTADLCIQGTGTGIEVKGCGNHVARICASQLAAHRDSIGFPKPFSNFLYCLFCYRNKTGKAKNGRPRRSLLSMCGSRDAIHTTLAQHTDRLYILDLQVIERLRETQGVVTGKFPMKDIEVIELGRRFLRSIRPCDTDSFFTSLGLDPEKWMIRERVVTVVFHSGLHKHSKKIRVTEVLTRDLVPDLDRAMRLPSGSTNCRRKMRIESKS